MNYIVKEITVVTAGNMAMAKLVDELKGQEISLESNTMDVHEGWASELVRVVTKSGNCTTTHLNILEPTFNYTESGTIEIIGNVPVWGAGRHNRPLDHLEIVLVTLQSKSFNSESK